MKLNKKGFTLIELLVVIAVLAMVFSVVTYSISNMINETKQKTYLTTKNEIEKSAGNFLIENSDSWFFVPLNNDINSGKEYHCVTIQNLVDAGFLDNNVIKASVDKDKTVSMDDYVYVERDKETKSITRKDYMANDDSLEFICRIPINATAYITFTSNSEEWSREKEITIVYKLKNASNYNEYEYNYSYIGGPIELISDNNDSSGRNKVVKVINNGTLNANVKRGDDFLDDKNLNISKIDRSGPNLKSNNAKSTVSKKATINLSVTDYGSGLDKKTFTKSDIKVMVGEHEITNFVLSDSLGCNRNNDDIETCDYNLTVFNDMYEGSVILEVPKDSFSDKVGNLNNDIRIVSNVTFSNPYKITLNDNNATTSGTKELEVYYGLSAIKPSTITLPKKTYVVKYNANGTGIQMPNSTNVNATFNGWFTSKNDGYKIINNTAKPSFVASADNYTDANSNWIKTSDTTLYAQWNSGNITLPSISKSDYVCAWREGSVSGSKYNVGEVRTVNKDITYYADCTDVKKPIANITSTSNLKAQKQIVTLTCSDNAGLVGYYFGTDSNPSTFTSISGKNFTKQVEVNAIGVYNFLCKDNEGNVSTKEKITFYSYKIANMLNKTDKEAGIYTTANYALNGALDVYMAPEGTTIIPSSLYTIPNGSNVNKYIGMSVGAAGSSAANMETTNPVLSSNNKTYTMWFNRNTVNIKYHMNGGVLAPMHNSNFSSDGSVIYCIGNCNGGRNDIIQIFKYNQDMGNDGLVNYNNPGWINITRTGYGADVGKEWFDGKKYYNQDTRYNANDICDVSSTDCTVTLYVNWIDNIPPSVEAHLYNGNSKEDRYLNGDEWFKFTPTLKFVVDDKGAGIDQNSAKLYWNASGKGNLNTTITNSNSDPEKDGEKCNTSSGNCSYNAGTITRTIGSGGYRYLILHICDNIGNCTDEEITFKLDNEKPTTPQINNPSNGRWVNASFPLTVSTNEKLSGISYWYYSYNENAFSFGSDANTQWVRYSSSADKTNFTTPDFSSQRNQYVYLIAYDKVGNASDVAKTWIAIDKTAPTISFSMTDSSDNPITSYSTTPNDSLATITVNPTLRYRGADSMSGLVVSATLRWNYIEHYNGFSETISNPDGEVNNWSDGVINRPITSNGNRYVKLTACDIAGNCTDHKVYFKLKINNCNMKTSPPNINIPYFNMANAYNSFVVSASSTSSDIRILSIASDFREVSPGVTAISINHVTYSSYKYAQCVAGQYGCKNPQYSYLLVCVVVSKNGCANQTFCKYRRAEDSTLYNGYGY